MWVNSRELKKGKLHKYSILACGDFSGLCENGSKVFYNCMYKRGRQIAIYDYGRFLRENRANVGRARREKVPLHYITEKRKELSRIAYTNVLYT